MWWIRQIPLTSRSLGLGLVAFAACFPVIYAVLIRASAHDGIRHFLFVVPSLAMLAGAGFDRTIDTLERFNTAASRVLGTGLAIMILWQAALLVRLHPYQNADYNALVGGLKGAQHRYVIDPSNTVPEATRALADHIRREFGSKPINQIFTVGVCCNGQTFRSVSPPFLNGPVPLDWKTADFVIEPADPSCHASGAEGEIIYEVKRLGTVLAVVKERRGLKPS
jgi:hypothetical protein